MSQVIVISVAGWCELNPDEVLFESETHTITGHEYLALDEDERDEYTLISISKAFGTSNAGEWTHFDMVIE